MVAAPVDALHVAVAFEPEIVKAEIDGALGAEPAARVALADAVAAVDAPALLDATTLAV
jgi:hypothetical protein